MTYNSTVHFNKTFEIFESEFEFNTDKIQNLSYWQNQFRSKLRSHLGLDLLGSDLEKHVPSATCHNSIEINNYIREEWTILVEPTVPLPFYLLKPISNQKSLPLVITPHGHNPPDMYVGIAKNEEDYQKMYGGDRDIAVQAVKEGYIAIAPTTRAFGETRTAADIKEDKTYSCREQLMHGLLVGRTPIGERVWDMQCIISWAIENLPIDQSKIAMTGNSGGGTITLFTAAIDTRIAIAIPSCYFCTFKGSIGAMRHCDCNYVPGILRLGEMYDIAGLITPRPFKVIAGRTDPIFPITCVKFAFSKLKSIYKFANASEHCQLYIGDGAHRYYKDGAWEFLARYFKN